MQVFPIHEALKPVEFLIGEWRSTNAEVCYPTMKKSLEYNEIVTFVSLGQPSLDYKSKTWTESSTGESSMKLMHLENGFLRIQPGTQHLSFMVSHNFGLNTLEEGTVCGNEIVLKSANIARMSFAKGQKVEAIERRLRLGENGNLEMELSMQTEGTPLSPHLKATYRKLD